MEIFDIKQILSQKFTNAFLSTPTTYISSSGRLEIIGNHTDHNHGLCLVAGVNMPMYGAAKASNNKTVRLVSEGFNELMEMNLSDLSIQKQEKATSIGLLRGVLARSQELGYTIGGFDLFVQSEVLKGSGVSSSAAFELLLTQVVNTLFNHNKMDALTMAKIGQYAEVHYFGKPCGLLDQVGVSFGGFNYLDFKSLKTPRIEHLTASLSSYQIFIIDTGGSHAQLTPYYTEIRSDMERVARYFCKQNLRSVSEKVFLTNIKELKDKVGGRAVLRAIHFYEENRRVKKAYNALKVGATKRFLKQIQASGDSSYTHLQNFTFPGDYQQSLSLTYLLSKAWIKDGAIRIHGGGFAGTLIAFVHVNEAADYQAKIGALVGEDKVYPVSIRPMGVMTL